MTTREKLINLRKSLGLSAEEFGERLNVSKQYISLIETGRRNVGLRFLKKVADAFKVPITSLIGDEDGFIITEDETSFILKLLQTATKEEKDKILHAIYSIRKLPLRQIPILGYVRAGEPIELTDITDPIDLVLLPEGETRDVSFAVIVKGDSMKDKGIEEGDRLLIDPNSPIESGSLVIAIIDNKATFKIFRKVDGKIFLEPANDNYEPIELTPNMDVKLYRVKMVIKKV